MDRGLRHLMHFYERHCRANRIIRSSDVANAAKGTFDASEYSDDFKDVTFNAK